MDAATRKKLLQAATNKLKKQYGDDVIFDVDDAVNSLALFSHNNGISNFANSLSSELVNLPTCGIVAYEIDCDRWSDFEMAEKRFLYFYSPKNV